MPLPKVSYSTIDPLLPDLIKTTDHKILAQWACSPSNLRPRTTLETLSVIRQASLDSHAAAQAADKNSSNTYSN